MNQLFAGRMIPAVICGQPLAFISDHVKGPVSGYFAINVSVYGLPMVPNPVSKATEESMLVDQRSAAGDMNQCHISIH